MKGLLTVSLIVLCSLSLVVFLHGCSEPDHSPEYKLHTVEIRMMKFQPSDITVNRGDTVIFINKDFVVHDVTEAESKRWNSMPLETDKSYRMVVTRSEGYYCSLHPVMKGKITVE